MPVLAYWKTRGLAQPIRLLLTYVGEEFEDRQYELGDAPDFSRHEWLEAKAQLAETLDFPNLPYYLDGDVRISQSNAILRHVARKHGLDGADVQEKAIVDMLLDVAMDLRNGMVAVCYNQEYDKVKADFFQKLQPAFLLFQKKLTGNDWFAGSKITVADFPFFELLTQLTMMQPGCLDDYSALKSFLQRFEALLEIKKYITRDDVMSLPVNNKSAAFIK